MKRQRVRPRRRTDGRCGGGEKKDKNGLTRPVARSVINLCRQSVGLLHYRPLSLGLARSLAPLPPSLCLKIIYHSLRLPPLPSFLPSLRPSATKTESVRRQARVAGGRRRGSSRATRSLLHSPSVPLHSLLAASASSPWVAVLVHLPSFLPHFLLLLLRPPRCSHIGKPGGRDNQSGRQ